MRPHYFLSSILPPLVIGQEPELSFRDLDHLLKANLNDKEYEKVACLRLFYDLQNILAYSKELTLDPYGNYSEKDLEEAVVVGGIFPSYVEEFLQEYEEPKERVKHFSKLLSCYYGEQQGKNHFLDFYLNLEYEMRLVLIGFRAKEMNRDVIKELIYEDSSNDIVAQILAQKDNKNYIAPFRYEDLGHIFDTHKANPLQLHQELIAYKFRKIEEYVQKDLFSLDNVLAYLVKLVEAEKWLELDSKKGMQIVDTILKEVS